mmetsp:Transcript_7478/g.8601  ORF Transcript_7478/g.8601 Transcript_7478/m.8601 type:complete len:320 (+) Transcript_7478:596-1555(+)|eukprot:CAMPEP_0184032572 /NCGR_PEP_ID=MMETSP0955-20130417/3134_1 /TAXON_ID=627963 /ORGANISM="Aplanochytrium sp, Strain PBS07" /LENGTH=319 /DNA_ID=CAMNT_0026318689 /DNA_START=528 /DNA_END=1487 /DNA_ORIENTATION=+
MKSQVYVKLATKIGTTWVASFFCLHWFVRSFFNTDFLRHGRIANSESSTGFDFIAFSGLVLAFSTSLILTVAAWFFFAIYRRWPVKPQFENKDGLEQTVTVETLLRNADTGDLLLFSTPMDMSGFFSGNFSEVLQTMAVKLYERVTWTHVGVVIRNPMDGKLYIAEATNEVTAGDYVGPGLCDLKTRLETSREFDSIAWRKLKPSPHFTSETIFRVLRWVYDMSENSCREDEVESDMGEVAQQLLCSNTTSPQSQPRKLAAQDCSTFAACLLRELGILPSRIAMERIRMSLYSTDIKSPEYSLPLLGGFAYGGQRRVVL